MAVQRNMAPSAPSRIIPMAPIRAVTRTDTANSRISATTPIAHSNPMAVPSRPLALHCKVPKPYITAWLAWIRLAPTTTVTNRPEHHSPPAAGFFSALPVASDGSSSAAPTITAIAAVSTQTRSAAPSVARNTPPAMLAKMKATDPHSRTGP